MESQNNRKIKCVTWVTYEEALLISSSSLQRASFPKLFDNFLIKFCVRVEVSEEECGNMGGQLEKKTSEV